MCVLRLVCDRTHTHTRACFSAHQHMWRCITTKIATFYRILSIPWHEILHSAHSQSIPLTAFFSLFLLSSSRPLLLLLSSFETHTSALMNGKSMKFISENGAKWQMAHRKKTHTERERKSFVWKWMFKTSIEFQFQFKRDYTRRIVPCTFTCVCLAQMCVRGSTDVCVCWSICMGWAQEQNNRQTSESIIYFRHLPNWSFIQSATEQRILHEFVQRQCLFPYPTHTHTQNTNGGVAMIRRSHAECLLGFNMQSTKLWQTACAVRNTLRMSK